MYAFENVSEWRAKPCKVVLWSSATGQVSSRAYLSYVWIRGKKGLAAPVPMPLKSRIGTIVLQEWATTQVGSLSLMPLPLAVTKPSSQQLMAIF